MGVVIKLEPEISKQHIKFLKFKSFSNSLCVPGSSCFGKWRVLNSNEFLQITLFQTFAPARMGLQGMRKMWTDFFSSPTSLIVNVALFLVTDHSHSSQPFPYSPFPDSNWSWLEPRPLYFFSFLTKREHRT